MRQRKCQIAQTALPNLFILIYRHLNGSYFFQRPCQQITTTTSTDKPLIVHETFN
uniref:Uncharacterized protein n=1 Tax=Rhizophora mucronata TaxID=61149 RepID=A0A2P2K6C3_RHIMU